MKLVSIFVKTYVTPSTDHQAVCVMCYFIFLYVLKVSVLFSDIFPWPSYVVLLPQFLYLEVYTSNNTNTIWSTSMCKESLPGWYARRTRAWHSASSWSEPLWHSTKYSFTVLHTDIMHKSTIYSMYGGGTSHRRVGNSQNKGGNIATKGMSKCRHVFGVLIGSYHLCNTTRSAVRVQRASLESLKRCNRGVLR